MFVCVLYTNLNCWTDLEENWHRGRFLGGFWSGTPKPGNWHQKGVQGASGASAMHFWQKLSKQKLQGDLIYWGRFTFSDPKSRSGRTWGPCPSGAIVTHMEGYLLKSKLYYSYLVGLDTLYFHTGIWGGGGKKGIHWGSGASARHFITQKLQATLNLVGVGNLFGPQNQDLKGPGLHVLLGPWPSLSRVVVTWFYLDQSELRWFLPSTEWNNLAWMVSTYHILTVFLPKCCHLLSPQLLQRHPKIVL